MGDGFFFYKSWSMVCTFKTSVGFVLAVAVSVGLGCSVFPTGSDEEPSDDVAPLEERVIIVEGTLDGPATQGNWDAAIKEPNVECGLDEIAHDDLDDQRSEHVPRQGWEQPQVTDGERCGDDFETLLYRLTNCERRARGLEPLQCDERLVWASRAHSKDMRDRDYFDHQTPEGRAAGDRMTDFGIQWRMSAENIAIAPTMALAHSGWMESEGHRRNILRPQAEYMGVGIVKADGGYVMTTLFAGGYD